MGKSSEATQLERTLRVKFTTNRIILRVNLNEVQRALSTVLPSDSAQHVLIKLAPFLPIDSLRIPEVRMFVLLDGLDEVCPRHQETMINLLRILKSKNMPNIRRVFLSTRPHLKEAMEKEFIIESYSLLPLSVEEQTKHMKAELEFTSDQLDEILKKIPDSLRNLLSNPLMLSMLVDILNSGETATAPDLNMFDLYSRFVESKHKLHLLQKEKMNEEDNYTEMRMHSMLDKSLPYYNRIAIGLLARSLPIVQSKIVADEDPSGLTKLELLSFGLLLQDSWGELIFKHLSFAEFFYARLLLHPETPQEARDTLFGHIYKSNLVLENVEVFVAAALAKQTLRTPLRLTSEWLLPENYMSGSYHVLPNFVGGQLFPILVREILMTFVSEKGGDMFPAFCILVDRKFRVAFKVLVDWMTQNAEWSRINLFSLPAKHISYSTVKISSAAAQLMVTISMIFEDQLLFTPEEVQRALESTDRLLTTVASIPVSNMTKWPFIERHMEGFQFRKLVQNADHFDFLKIIDDKECAMKSVEMHSRDELYSLVSEEKTRVTDIVGMKPLAVFCILGENFLNPLAQFRAKFEDGSKGKTAFEMDSYIHSFDYLWDDLTKEMEQRNEEGPVTTALREAIERRTSWEVLRNLEKQIRWRRKCPRDSQESGHVIEWLVGNGSLWDKLTSFPLELLPFIVRYSGSLKHVTQAVQQAKQGLIKFPGVLEPNLCDDKQTIELSRKYSFQYHQMLLSCHQGHVECFPLISELIQENLQSIPPDFKPVAEALTAVTAEELKAKLIPHRPHSLVSDVSVGNNFIRLVGVSSINWEQMRVTDVPSGIVITTVWDIVADVIRYTRCCDLPAYLDSLRELPEKNLKAILLSEGVLRVWMERVSWGCKKREDGPCSLKGLLSFYFSVFGLNLDWFMVNGKLLQTVQIHLVRSIQVEIAMTLEGNPKWIHLAAQLEALTRRFCQEESITTVNELARYVDFKTEDEWTRLLRMLGENNFQPGPRTDISLSSGFAAPLICACIRTFGVEAAKIQLKTLWELIRHNLEDSEDTPQSKASVFHSAILLGELKHVDRFAFPGLVSWRNAAGKNALDIAKEALGEDHPISIHLEKQINPSRVR